MLQDQAELAEFHNHALAPWPSFQLLSVDPVGFFRASRTWLSEHIFPVQLATHVQKTVLVYWLNEAPESRVSLGKGGPVFLTDGQLASSRQEPARRTRHLSRDGRLAAHRARDPAPRARAGGDLAQL